MIWQKVKYKNKAAYAALHRSVAKSSLTVPRFAASDERFHPARDLPVQLIGNKTDNPCRSPPLFTLGRNPNLQKVFALVEIIAQKHRSRVMKPLAEAMIKQVRPEFSSVNACLQATCIRAGDQIDTNRTALKTKGKTGTWLTSA